MLAAQDFTYQISNLSTGYRRGGATVTLLRSMHAQLHRGQLTCLIGVNGAGKSTLLRTMAGLQPAIAGNVALLGKPLEGYSAKQLATKVSVVLTDKIPEQNLTAFELVAMGRMPYTGYWGSLGDSDRTMVNHMLQLVGMHHFANRRISSLSDGERQKLMIAKALAQDTDVVLLDEPVAFLDFPSKVAVLRLLAQTARKTHKSILLSIHDIEIALQLADLLWILTGDGFVEGKPHALARDGKIDFLFDGEGINFNRDTLQYSLT